MKKSKYKLEFGVMTVDLSQRGSGRRKRGTEAKQSLQQLTSTCVAGDCGWLL